MQNWKVASTSLPGYLWCEYGSWDMAATTEAVPDGYSVVTAVRNPIKRFLSAMAEELERSVNGYCPSGYCTFENDYWQGDTTLDKYEHQVPVHKILASAFPLLELHLLPKNHTQHPTSS